MTEREPQLQDYGVTPEQFAFSEGELVYWHLALPFAFVCIFSTAFLVVFVYTDSLKAAFGAGFTFTVLPGLPLPFLASFGIERAILARKRRQLQSEDVDARIEQYKAAVALYRQVQHQQYQEEQARREAQWSRSMRSIMTDDVLKFILHKAEEGIKCEVIPWKLGWLGPLTSELLYCEEKGFVDLYYSESTIQPFIGLTETGKIELARLRESLNKPSARPSSLSDYTAIHGLIQTIPRSL